MTEVDEDGVLWEVKSSHYGNLLETYQKYADLAEAEVQKRIAEEVAKFKAKSIALIRELTCGYATELIVTKLEALK